MKPFLIGVTGIMGGGKSSFLKYLETLRLSVIRSDDVAKSVIYTANNKDILVHNLGETIIGEDGEYDKKEIRRILFSDKTKKQWLERVYSHDVWREIERLAQSSGNIIVFIENAVLFEQGWKDYFNFIVCLYCDQEVVIRRVTESRNISRDEVLQIMLSQLSIETKILHSDVSIDTTDIPENEQHQIADLILEAMEMCS